MKSLRILDYDILLQDLGQGKGKVIIAGFDLNTSYYWGAMGENLEDFICSIDTSYWLNKLLPLNVDKPINSRKTFAAFRKQLKECLQDRVYPYGWWVEREFQAEMWEKVRDIQQSATEEYEFIDAICLLPEKLDYYLIADKYDRESFKEAIQNACSEPWYCTVKGESREERMLIKLHKALKKELKRTASGIAAVPRTSGEPARTPNSTSEDYAG
jgi:hypothetical protein